MIQTGPATRVFLAAGPTDMRKGFDGLVDLVRHRLASDPLNGQLFSRLAADHNRVVLENKLLRLEKYGAPSERLSDGQVALVDGEPSVVAAEVEHETRQPAVTEPPVVPKPAPVRRHPGRVELPAHLERREVIIPCAEQDCVCAHCRQTKPVIGYERSEELDVIPAHYFVKVTPRERRACPQHPEGGVSRAPAPAGILPRSKLSDGLMVDVLIKKYGDHLPAYRQSATLARDAQIELSRNTLIEVILVCGSLLQGLMPALQADLLAGHYIQADETPVLCQVPEVTGRNHQAYLWEYSRPGGPVLFTFRMSRRREGPGPFCGGSAAGCNVTGMRPTTSWARAFGYAACLAHARREFHRAHLLAKLDPWAREVLSGSASFMPWKRRRAGGV